MLKTTNKCDHKMAGHAAADCGGLCEHFVFSFFWKCRRHNGLEFLKWQNWRQWNQKTSWTSREMTNNGESMTMKRKVTERETFSHWKANNERWSDARMDVRMTVDDRWSDLPFEHNSMIDGLSPVFSNEQLDDRLHMITTWFEFWSVFDDSIFHPYEKALV